MEDKRLDANGVLDSLYQSTRNMTPEQHEELEKCEMKAIKAKGTLEKANKKLELLEGKGASEDELREAAAKAIKAKTSLARAEEKLQLLKTGVVSIKKKTSSKYIAPAADESAFAKIAALEKENAAKKEKLEKEKARLQQIKETAIEQIRADRNEQFAKMEAEKETELARLKAIKDIAVERLKKDREEMLAKLEAEKTAAIKALEEEKAREIAMLKDERTKTIASIYANRDAKLAETAAAIDDDINSL